MFIHVPGLTDQGVQTEQLTEYVDLFPTLAEAALGETIPSCPRVSKNVTMCTGACVCVCVCVKTGRARMRDACYDPYPACIDLNMRMRVHRRPIGAAAGKGPQHAHQEGGLLAVPARLRLPR